MMQNDLISRSALLKNRTRMTEYDETGCGVHVFVVKEEDVLNAQAVDVEPVEYSMWLEHAGSQNTRYWTCLKCDTLGSPRWKRCPICEAKMNAEVEG